MKKKIFASLLILCFLVGCGAKDIYGLNGKYINIAHILEFEDENQSSPSADPTNTVEVAGNVIKFTIDGNTHKGTITDISSNVDEAPNSFFQVAWEGSAPDLGNSLNELIADNTIDYKSTYLSKSDTGDLWVMFTWEYEDVVGINSYYVFEGK